MAKSVKFVLITITIILIYVITPALSVNTQPADFESWRDKAIGWATDHINSLKWNGLCMEFVACAFQQSENGYAGGNADDIAKKFPLFDGNLNPDVLDKTPGGWDNIPKGAIIFFAGTPANKIGHVGIHIGNGWIIHAFGRVMTTQISKATSLTDKGKLVVGSYMGWSYPPESWRPATQSNSIGASVANPAVEKLKSPQDQITSAIANDNSNLKKVPPKTVLKTPSQITKLAVTLTLDVRDGSASGPIIPGAQVSGQDGSGNSFQQTTDNNGYVTITGDPGTWSFSASADGYTTKPWDQEITEDCIKHAFLKREQQSESVATYNNVTNNVTYNITSLKREQQSESAATTTQGSESSVVGVWKTHYDYTVTSNCPDATYGDSVVTNGHVNCIYTFYKDGTYTQSEMEGNIDGDDHPFFIPDVSGKWVQNGNTVRLQDSEGSFDMTINGDMMTWTSSRDDQEGHCSIHTQDYGSAEKVGT